MVKTQSSSQSITAVLDRDGRILSADAPLYDLHYANRGLKNGILAVPELLSLCFSAQELGMRLSRKVEIDRKDAIITLWAKVNPKRKKIKLKITNWSEHRLLFANPVAENGRKASIGKLNADGHIKLDTEQNIVAMSFNRNDPAIAPRNYVMRHWRDVFEFTLQRKAAKSWQSYTGQCVTLPGLDTIWMIDIRPLSHNMDKSKGFDVYLTEVQETETSAHMQLLSSEQMKKFFGEGLASGLQAPIDRIIANAEMMEGKEMGPLRADYAAYAGDIMQAGQHLHELVTDISDTEMVERDDFIPVRNAIDLANIGRKAATLLSVQAVDHDIHIDAPADDENLSAMGDYRRVLQIVLNLLTNAVRYSPAASMVWVRLEQDGELARLVVADQGGGLTEEEQARIFDKFERLGRSHDGGSGLGLYISRRLARAMGGDLKVESAPGQGARFILELPSNSGGKA
ncbi:HAMP domain-containing sensor histidine kinase [Sphingorhabdus sp. Alg239-R122]|uniref:sensor histidine kinase n=1 Tax=Sphingorhabdus sp. Alg239-R122 TaxID=2305989 RepID=UPI0013DCA082|nr:HAMP domain-containing sensor histidine kinase [Sphingorhabdus sp. Alg239-R122]